MTKICLENVELYIPTTSVWETVGGNEEIATVNFLRGCFLSSFGMIETLLKEIAIVCSKIDCYQPVVGNIPYKKSTLIKFLRQILEIEGPLQQAANPIESVIIYFDENGDLRNQWAHGHLKCLPGERGSRMSGSWITLKTIEGLNASHFKDHTSRWPITEIEQQALVAKQFAEIASKVYSELLANLNVPT